MYDIAIVCGGKATRLSSITHDEIPKSLIDINGKPFIYHQLKLLESNGFKHVVLCVGYLGEMIQKYVESQDFHMKIDFSYDGETPLGTGGSILNAFPLLTDKFFVLYGDSYLPIKYKKIENYYKHQCNKLALMTIYRNENPSHRNNVSYWNGEILLYCKDYQYSAMDFIDYGINILDKKLFEGFEDEGKFDLSWVLEVASIERNLAGYEIKQQFYEVGSLEGIEELKKYLKEENG